MQNFNVTSMWKLKGTNGATKKSQKLVHQPTENPNFLWLSSFCLRSVVESLWFLLRTTKKVLAYLKYKYFVHELEVRVYRLTNGEDSSIT